MSGERKDIPFMAEPFVKKEKVTVHYDKVSDIHAWTLNEARLLESEQEIFVLQNKNIDIAESYAECFVTKLQNGVTSRVKRSSDIFEVGRGKKSENHETHLKESIETVHSQYMLDVLDSMNELEKGDNLVQNSDCAMDHMVQDEGCKVEEQEEEVKTKSRSEDFLQNSAPTEDDACLAAGDPGHILQVSSEYTMGFESFLSPNTEKMEDRKENKVLASFSEVPTPDQKTRTDLEVSSNQQLTPKEISSSSDTLSDLEENHSEEILTKYAGKLIENVSFEEPKVQPEMFKSDYDDDVTLQYSISAFRSKENNETSIDSSSRERMEEALESSLNCSESGMDIISVSSAAKEILLSQQEIEDNGEKEEKCQWPDEYETSETKLTWWANSEFSEDFSEIKLRLTPDGVTVLKDDHEGNDVMAVAIDIKPDAIWINKAKVWKETRDYDLLTCEIKVRLTPNGAVVVHDENEENGDVMKASIDITSSAVWLNKTTKLLDRK